MPDSVNGKPRVYLHRSTITLGTGSTSRNVVSENYHQAEDLPDGTIKLTLLDMNDQPTGLSEIVTPEELARDYQLAPDYFESRKTKEEKEVEKKLATGQAHLERQEYNSAEFEFDQVLKLDDRRLEAHLGKGEALIGQGDVEAAEQVFSRLSQIEELYEAKNKHVFNRYGMTLRQSGLYDQAIAAYRRALSLDPGDENLFYNMARALYDKGELTLSQRVLAKVLQLKADHQEARALLKRLEKS